MAQPLFLFVQFEFPWPLGIPDGRYLLRAGRDGSSIIADHAYSRKALSCYLPLGCETCERLGRRLIGKSIGMCSGDVARD